MSQEYRELLGGDTLSDSRVDLNEANDALLTDFAGPNEPPASIRKGGMTWLDTAEGKVKQRNLADTAWIEIGELDVEDHGMLSRLREGQTMSVSFNMGGKAIEGLGVGSGTSAARKQDVDLKAPIDDPLFTGDARVSQDPAGANSIARKSWLDGTYLAKAGGLANGRIGTISLVAAGLNEFLKRSEIQNLVTFSNSTGHRHDGTDARKVRGIDLELSDITGKPEVLSRLIGEVVHGRYTADNTNDRFIALPWEPWIVIVSHRGGGSTFITGIAINFHDVGIIDGSGDFLQFVDSSTGDNSRKRVPDISGAGFYVSQISGGLGLNDGTNVYDFWAIQ